MHDFIVDSIGYLQIITNMMMCGDVCLKLSESFSLSLNLLFAITVIGPEWVTFPYQGFGLERIYAIQILWTCQKG